MSCSNKIWFTILIVGISLMVFGNMLSSTTGSQMTLIGLLCILLVLLVKLTPWVLFYKENHTGRVSRKMSDHPERLPIVSRFPNGDFLVAVREKRFRMWMADTEIYCQEVSPETGHLTGPRCSNSSQAAALGIPSDMYKRLEQGLRSESRFL